MIILSLFLTSCAGYHIESEGNPLRAYGIKSLSFPMFINDSSVSRASLHLTREFYRIFSNYPDLKVKSGENVKTDAIVVGIISSRKKRNAVFQNGSYIYTEGTFDTSIGNRRHFYVPQVINYQVFLDLYIIKDPQDKEMALFQSGNKALLEKILPRHPRVVLHSHIPVNGSYTRHLKETATVNSPGLANMTQSAGNFEESLQSIAISTAKDFKETVLNVF